MNLRRLPDLNIMVTGLSNSFFANKPLSGVATRRILKMILLGEKINNRERCHGYIWITCHLPMNRSLLLLLLLLLLLDIDITSESAQARI